MMSILDLFDLDGRVALVTDGSRGIGRAIALGLSEAGATVVPASRTREDIEDTVDTIEDRGGEALAATVDVTDEESVTECFDTIAVYDSGREHGYHRHVNDGSLYRRHRRRPPSGDRSRANRTDG